MKLTIVPIVIGALGTVTKGLLKGAISKEVFQNCSDQRKTLKSLSIEFLSS